VGRWRGAGKNRTGTTAARHRRGMSCSQSWANVQPEFSEGWLTDKI
jgi:hypothetical protein